MSGVGVGGFVDQVVGRWGDQQQTGNSIR